MNFKPALIGAVFVALAGLVVGIAIGGKEVERVRTVVEPEADPAETAAQESDESADTSDTEAAAPVEEPAPSDDFFSEREEEPVGENFTINESGRAEIGRKAYDSSVVVELFDFDTEDPARVEYSPGAGATRLRGALGFQTGTETIAQARLEIRKDTARGALLYEKDFSSPAVIDEDVDIALEGATTLVFLWRTDTDPEDFDFPEFPFVLGDVRFSE